ncbi:hypothetical protein QTV49_000591 [Vibrio vulnificus]|nr:hypothetical protein [Vibrio vulnificus]
MQTTQLSESQELGLKVLFANWTEEECISEMMECHKTITNLKKYSAENYSGIDEFREAKKVADSALSILSFMKLSQTLPESVVTTAEVLFRECELRISSLNYTPKLKALATKNKFNYDDGISKEYEASSNHSDNDGCRCDKCGETDSLEPILDGSVHCLECNAIYFP